MEGQLTLFSCSSLEGFSWQYPFELAEALWCSELWIVWVWTASFLSRSCIVWLVAGTCLLSRTAGLWTFFLCPKLARLVPCGLGEHTVESILPVQHSSCSLPCPPLPPGLCPLPVLRAEAHMGKAACTCVAVCRSADAPGKAMGCLIPEEDMWQCAEESQPCRKPLVMLCEKPSSCGLWHLCLSSGEEYSGVLLLPLAWGCSETELQLRGRTRSCKDKEGSVCCQHVGQCELSTLSLQPVSGWRYCHMSPVLLL